MLKVLNLCRRQRSAMTLIDIRSVAEDVSSMSLSPSCGQPVSAQSTHTPLHERIAQRIKAGTAFFSLEFFPARAEEIDNFYTRISQCKEGNPLFIDVTWQYAGDAGNLARETSTSSIAAGCLEYCKVETMMHMTCSQYTKERTMAHLEQSKRFGLRNIFPLTGFLPPNATSDAPVGKPKYQALDMIRWIKEEFGDYFSIGCSGYPQGHPTSTYDEDLSYLKAKVDAGANFIVSKFFFEAEKYERFVRDCREIGITVPIIPGIIPFESYDGIRGLSQNLQLAIPDSILADLEPIKHDSEAVRNYGRHHAVEMCRRLLSNGSAPGVHFLTMNNEGFSREILQELGLWGKRPMRTLPWEQRQPPAETTNTQAKATEAVVA